MAVQGYLLDYKFIRQCNNTLIHPKITKRKYNFIQINVFNIDHLVGTFEVCVLENPGNQSLDYYFGN